MRKLFFSAFLIAWFGGYLHAAQIYTVTDGDFAFDPSTGTFVVNGSTFGAIVGLRYEITLQDSVTLNTCKGSNTVQLANPSLVFPSSTTLLNRIQNNVTNSEMKIRLQGCIIGKNQNALTTDKIANDVSGVVGSTVTPP